MQLNRKRPGWEAILVDHIRARRKMPFAWGRNDCGTAAFDLVHALTGDRVVETTWDDALSAMRIVEREGGLCAWGDRLFGQEGQTGQTRMQRGDVCVVATYDGREAFAVCIDFRVAGPGEHELMFYPRDRVIKYWRIGR